MSIFLLSPHPIEQPSKNPSDAATRTVDLHGLRIFQQPNRSGKLRILRCRGESGGGLSMRDMCRHFENLAGEVIDPVEQAAASGDENSRADIINKRLFLDGSLEELECLAESKMNDRVKGFAFDFLSSKPRIVFQDNRFSGQAIAQDTTSFLDL